MLIECDLNALAAWMIFEPQAMIKIPSLHCGPPLPPSEGVRIASGDGHISFTALLSCCTPIKASLSNPPPYQVAYYFIPFQRHLCHLYLGSSPLHTGT